MSSRTKSTVGGESGGYRRIVVLVICLVIVPTTLLLALGILMLVFWQARLNLLFGILVVTLVGVLVTGTVLALVFLRREARLSRLQLDFVSKVSHELRTPLTSIRMFVETLRRHDQKPAERQMCLEVLDHETTRLNERIERLLDWGRMEAGRRVYELEPVAVADVVMDGVDAFRSVSVEDGTEPAVEIEPELPPIRADRGALADALLNLLTNAWKYSRHPRRITVAAHSVGRSVRITVSDNGIGVPQSEQRRIFQKFYRADDRLARESEGSGLGLAIVRHVARGHGGRVEVESAPGEGSTFTIVVPAAKEVRSEQ